MSWGELIELRGSLVQTTSPKPWPNAAGATARLIFRVVLMLLSEDFSLF